MSAPKCIFKWFEVQKMCKFFGLFKYSLECIILGDDRECSEEGCQEGASEVITRSPFIRILLFFLIVFLVSGCTIVVMVSYILSNSKNGNLFNKTKKLQVDSIEAWPSDNVMNITSTITNTSTKIEDKPAHINKKLTVSNFNSFFLNL